MCVFGRIQSNYSIKKVVANTADYLEPSGVILANYEKTEKQVLDAIDAYTKSLRDGIAVNEKLPISNCVREIKSRLRKLSKMNADLEQSKRAELQAEFAGYFD